MRFVDRTVAAMITGFVRVLTGTQARWVGCAPALTQRIYFANHASHADFALIWAALPSALRSAVRPVAGSDYWDQGPIRRYLIHQVLHGVLIDRNPETRTEDPVEKIVAVLASGASLIVFPEGTRNVTDELLLPFRSGMYYIAQRRPDVEWVPVWLENARRVMPKGEVVPLPLLCSVNFGEPVRVRNGEEKSAFLERAHDALLGLAARVRPKP